MKKYIIPTIMLIMGFVAVLCAIMYISYGTVIPVLSPLSLGMIMAMMVISERQGHNRTWLKALCVIVGVLCIASAAAQLLDII